MKIGLVAPVKPSHSYLENGPALLLDLHYLRIAPWFRWPKGSSASANRTSKPIPRWDVHFGILKTTERTPRLFI